MLRALLGREHSSKYLVTDASAFDGLCTELLATVDDAGYFRRLTPAWERALGHSLDDLLELPIAALVHPDDVPHTQAALRRLAEGDAETARFESRFRHRDDRYLWLEWDARFSGNDRLIYVAARDRSERRRAAEELGRAKERAERADRAKSEFLSRMSHELRTPLTSVIGFSELLLKDGVSSEQRLKLEHVHNAGQHLLGLIDELLDISRVEAGTMTASPEPIQVGALLGETLASIKPQAAERELAVSADLEACRDSYVMADRQRLRQVVLNLLSNAIKYNRPGGELSLRASGPPSGLCASA